MVGEGSSEVGPGRGASSRKKHGCLTHARLTTTCPSHSAGPTFTIAGRIEERPPKSMSPGPGEPASTRICPADQCVHVHTPALQFGRAQICAVHNNKLCTHKCTPENRFAPLTEGGLRTQLPLQRRPPNPPSSPALPPALPPACASLCARPSPLSITPTHTPCTSRRVHGACEPLRACVHHWRQGPAAWRQARPSGGWWWAMEAMEQGPGLTQSACT